MSRCQSDWGQAPQGLLALPAELMTTVPAFADGPIEPAFVPLAITTEPKTATDALPNPEQTLYEGARYEGARRCAG